MAEAPCTLIRAPIRLSSGTCMKALAPLRDLDASFPQNAQRSAKVLGTAIVQHHLAAGDRSGAGIGAGLDPIGDDGVLGAVEALHALDGQAVAADAFDARTHS